LSLKFEPTLRTLMVGGFVDPLQLNKLFFWIELHNSEKSKSSLEIPDFAILQPFSCTTRTPAAAH
jgi:hypothetical protein